MQGKSEQILEIVEKFSKIIGYCTVGIDDLLYLNKHIAELLPNNNPAYLNREYSCVDRSIFALEEINLLLLELAKVDNG